MQNTTILITNDGMGKADLALQHKLIGKYLEIIQKNGNLPNAICFYADGVKLTVEGSPVLAQLAELEDNGVRLIICFTCLDYFGLTDKVKVGVVGGMGDIVEAQVKADKVITI